MSKRWMREVKLAGATNRGVPVLIKLWNLFLQKVCGYTYVSQDASAGDFNTYEKTGVNGSFTGASFRFTDATAASFVAGDTNKWILIVDPTNVITSGWYKVTYVDASNVDIDFRAAAAEFPAVASGLTWYLVGETYDMPATINDYVRIQTPHADGWQLEIRYITGGSSSQIAFYLSVNAVWGAGQKLLSGTVFNLNGLGTNDVYNYIVADTDGTFVMFWQWSTSNYHTASGVMRIETEFEVGHAAIEKWSLFGTDTPTPGGLGTRITRWPDDAGWHRVWRENIQAQRRGRLLEITNNVNDASFCYNTTANEVNVRTTKNDLMPGSFLIVDEDNAQDLYEIPGMVCGTYMIRNNVGTKTAISHDATRDIMHIADGIAIDWPGLTPQF